MPDNSERKKLHRLDEVSAEEWYKIEKEVGNEVNFITESHPQEEVNLNLDQLEAAMMQKLQDKKRDQ